MERRGHIKFWITKSTKSSSTKRHEAFEYERGTKGEGLCHGGTGRRRGGKVSREDYNRIFVLFSIKKA
jgi:hypothetical protein